MSLLQDYAASFSTEFKYHANHNHNNNQLIVKAGCLSMIYENGNIRRIKAGSNEVLRMIYPTVRGKGWLTFYPAISNEKIEINADSFRIHYLSHYKAGEINFQAHISIEGYADNSVIFSMDGAALSDFEKNRIGFCILHPADHAGKILELGYTDGRKEILKFPLLISPHQPFTDIRNMQWTIMGYRCSLDLSGDVFETEDHRNWTDASYKTYCTPIKIPYPVELKAGAKIRQTVSFRMEGEIEIQKEENNIIIITVHDDSSVTMPKIGIGQSGRKHQLSNNEAQILQKLKFDHYRSDIYLFKNDWLKKASIAADEALKIGCPLELAVFVDDNFHDQINGMLAWIEAFNPVIEIILIFHKDHRATPGWLINEVGSQIRKVHPEIKIGSGTNANFTQVNRARPDSDYLDYLVYSIHPQEHAGDNLTLTENLQAQGSTVESALRFSNGKGIWVSPVNIQRRFNANVENFENPAYNGNCPPQVDSRLLSLFGACWIAGSLKYLCEAGITGVTYLETVGERGIFQGEFPSQWPEEFPSVRGMVFPVLFVFQFIAGSKSFRIIRTESSEPLYVLSILFSDGNHIKMIIVNLTHVERTVSLNNIKENINLHIKQMNSETYEKAVSNFDWLEDTPVKIISSSETLLLNPFSITFIVES